MKNEAGMKDWSIEFLRSVLDSAPEGIVICEAAADQPVVYVNAAFEYLTGHAASDLLGRNLRHLQGNDREQDGRYRLQQAIERGDSCQALLRNYRKNGGVFWVDLHVQPVRDSAGRVTHFIGYHRDASDRPRTAVKALAGLPTWMREDRLTTLATRPYFEELLKRDWSLAQREMRQLGLAFFDVDNLGAYNDTYGRAGGDACIRRAASLIAASFRRGSDLLGRWDGGGVAVLAHGNSDEKLAEYSRILAQRVRDQQVHHPRSAAKFVTVSVGVASCLPLRDQPVSFLVNAAEAALARAKAQGRNRVVVAGKGDYRA
jgi:diguanylate cyclase (GGDEF)-like protein/PAS domain S-box-containing protein